MRNEQGGLIICFWLMTGPSTARIRPRRQLAGDGAPRGRGPRVRLSLFQTSLRIDVAMIGSECCSSSNPAPRLRGKPATVHDLDDGTLLHIFRLLPRAPLALSKGELLCR